MEVSVHPQAIVEEGAQLGKGVRVEAFALVGKNSVIGDGSIVRHHATVEGKVILGRNNEIFPYALIGGLTHDLKYTGGEPKLTIGDNNIFREYVTAHVATNGEDSTEIGSNNVFLAYSHVAHDCNVGNQVIMSSHSALGGHAIVGDHVNIGWGAGVHQFCKLGRYAMLSACSKLVQDVPPYMLADGSPAEVRSINKVAMERADISSEKVELVKSLFKILYKSGLNRTQALEQIKQQNEEENSGITAEILTFVSSSNRGIA